MVVGYPPKKDKIPWWSPTFAVAGVEICLSDTKKFSSPNILTTAEQAALSKKQSLKHHIWSKIRVVGSPKR